MTNPAQEVHVVLLERHPGPATEAETAACECRGDVRGRDLDPRGQPLDRRQQSRTMGLTGSQPTQHVKILPQRTGRTGQPVKPWTGKMTGNISPTHAPRIIEGPKAMCDERFARRARSRPRAMTPPLTKAARTETSTGPQPSQPSSRPSRPASFTSPNPSPPPPGETRASPR